MAKKTPKTISKREINKRAKKLLDEAGRQMLSDHELSDALRQADSFEASPSWYTRFMPRVLWDRFVLMGKLVDSYKRGEYRRVPWTVMASLVFAALSFSKGWTWRTTGWLEPHVEQVFGPGQLAHLFIKRNITTGWFSEALTKPRFKIPVDLRGKAVSW